MKYYGMTGSYSNAVFCVSDDLQVETWSLYGWGPAIVNYEDFLWAINDKRIEEITEEEAKKRMANYLKNPVYPAQKGK